MSNTTERLDYAIYMRDQSHPGTLSFVLWNGEVKRLLRAAVREDFKLSQPKRQYHADGVMADEYEPGL